MWLLLLANLLLLSPIAWAERSKFEHATTSGCDKACHEIHQLLPGSTFLGEDARIEMWSLFQTNARPKCRVEPRNTEDVATVLRKIVSHACLFAVLGGGTSPFSGVSNADGGITIDLGRLSSIQLQSDEAVSVGGGVLWADLYRFLDPRSLSSAGTRNSLTGIVGSIIGGGISFFSQRHGWSCDNVRELEVVLANSSVVMASEHVNPDLFWALRGGGNNFGIVTRVMLDIFPQSSSWYTFQRWDMQALESVFDRLERLTNNMPTDIQMVATTLGWAPHLQEFVISERLVASGEGPPELPKTLSISASDPPYNTTVLDEYVYTKTTLEMAEKMDRMNAEGFFNYFGSMTVKSHKDINLIIAEIFMEEVKYIRNAQGIQVYIVYNPITVPAMQQMRRRGGNALGLDVADGALTIVNINLHWSLSDDTPRMQTFMRRLLARVEAKAKSKGAHHPYVFLNHCFEEQDPIASYGKRNMERLQNIADAIDPRRVFQVLQPGHHKLWKRGAADWRGRKSEL